MLETLRNAFKIKDIRKRIIFTFLMLVVIRIGSQLPIPGVDSEVFANWFASQTADGMGFFDAVTGGSFLNLSIFALNITPYITSSIIMQLLTIAIPKLEEMQRDGEDNLTLLHIDGNVAYNGPFTVLLNQVFRAEHHLAFCHILVILRQM